MGIVAFSVGSVNVYSYGLAVSFAIVLGLFVTKLFLRFRRERVDFLSEIFIYGMVGGLIGARIGYVLFHFSFYRENYGEIFAVYHGGVSLYGAFVGLIAAMFLYSRLRRLSFWRCLDLITPAILLGGSLVQLSHFAFQVTVGSPVAGGEAADSKIIEYIEYSFRPAGFQGYEYFKPVALYQALWQFVLFFIVMMAAVRGGGYKLQEGCLFLLSLMFVCLGRFLFGFLYLGAENGLSGGQTICLFVAAACFFIMIKRRRENGGKGQVYHWL